MLGNRYAAILKVWLCYLKYKPVSHQRNASNDRHIHPSSNESPAENKAKFRITSTNKESTPAFPPVLLE